MLLRQLQRHLERVAIEISHLVFEPGWVQGGAVCRNAEPHLHVRNPLDAYGNLQGQLPGWKSRPVAAKLSPSRTGTQRGHHRGWPRRGEVRRYYEPPPLLRRSRIAGRSTRRRSTVARSTQPFPIALWLMPRPG